MDKADGVFAHEPLARNQADREERLQMWRRVALGTLLVICAALAYLGHNDVHHRGIYRLALTFPLGMYLHSFTVYTRRKKGLQPLDLSGLMELQGLAQANPAIDVAISRWRSGETTLRQRDLAACRAYARENGTIAKLSDLKWD